MSYVTISQIAERAEKDRATVVRALKAAKVDGQNIPGVKGVRISIAVANRFLARQWPGVIQFGKEVES